MATHDGTWMKENDPITPSAYRLKLINPTNGTKYAILDCATLPDPLPVDDVLRVNTPVQRCYKVTSQVSPLQDGAMRVVVEPVTYVAP